MADSEFDYEATVSLFFVSVDYKGRNYNQDYGSEFLVFISNRGPQVDLKIILLLLRLLDYGGLGLGVRNALFWD